VHFDEEETPKIAPVLQTFKIHKPTACFFSIGHPCPKHRDFFQLALESSIYYLVVAELKDNFVKNSISGLYPEMN
jgi:hypothetical protein